MIAAPRNSIDRSTCSGHGRQAVPARHLVATASAARTRGGESGVAQRPAGETGAGKWSSPSAPGGTRAPSAAHGDVGAGNCVSEFDTLRIGWNAPEIHDPIVVSVARIRSQRATRRVARGPDRWAPLTTAEPLQSGHPWPSGIDEQRQVAGVPCSVVIRFGRGARQSPSSRAVCGRRDDDSVSAGQQREEPFEGRDVEARRVMPASGRP